MLNTTPSKVIDAPKTHYNPAAPCAICLNRLDAVVFRLGVATVHDSANGLLHPMHRECFLNVIKLKPECPICKESIDITSFKIPTISTFEKTARIGALCVFGAAAHGILTKLLQSSIVVAAAPGILSTIGSFVNLYKEHRDLGLQRSIRDEIKNDLFIGGVSIGLPTLGAVIANNVTKSLVLNSLITSTVTAAGLLVLNKTGYIK